VLAFATGIAIEPHFYLPAHQSILILSGCAGFAPILFFFHRDRQALAVAWIGFFVAGSLWAGLEHSEPPAAHLLTQVREKRIDISRPLKVSGWLETSAQARPGSYIFDLSAESVEQAGIQRPASGVIRVYYYPKEQSEPPLNLQYGNRVEILVGNLRAPRNYGNPGMFDYAASMARRGISYTALLRNRNADLKLLEGTGGSRAQGLILQVRESMLQSIERLLPGQPVPQSVLKAMLLGDDSWLSEKTEEAFQRSGTYHVLVISGWNVAVFAGPLLLLLDRTRIATWVSSLLVLMAVTSFALIAQWEIPIVRASSMFLIYLIARLFFRHRVLINSLAGAALILLIAHPSDLFDWGFQLSFLAVLTLSAIALPLVEWKLAPLRHALDSLTEPARDLHFTPSQAQFRMDLRAMFMAIAAGLGVKQDRWQIWIRGLRGTVWGALAIAEALYFTTWMQVGYALVSAHYFHRLTWSGILGNLLILPIASCIVLFGMLALPMKIMLPSMGRLLGPLLGWLCTSLEGVARFTSEIHGLSLRVPTPPIWLSVFFLFSSCLLALLVSQRSRWAVGAGAALLLSCLGLSFPLRQTACSTGKLDMTALDVGQGDALLVCFPRGSTMLVDAGGTIPVPGSPVRRQDIGETVVSPYLWARGISRIDYVVLSHDHFDHMGGLEAVFENFDVGEFWIGPDAETRKMNWLRQRAERAGAHVNWPVRASTSGSAREIDGVKVEVLSPPANWAPTKVSNNDSIVLSLTYGQRKFLLAGDIESSMERTLAASDASLDSDVLKVAHHGSRTSSTPEFLARVTPAISVVSVGAYGRFGHPNREVLNRLQNGHKLVYLTPEVGAISVSSDGNKLEVGTFYDYTFPWSAR
jgi:competence protein ComEC